MQYGAELLSYRRSKKEEKNKKSVDYSIYIKGGAFFAAALLVSRVMLINKMAPFGIAFLFAVFMNKDEKVTLLSGGGALLGYITLYKNIENVGYYLVMTGSLVVLRYFIGRLSKRGKLAAVFLVLFSGGMLYNLLISSYSAGVNILATSFEMICIFSLYFIMSYGLLCAGEIRTRHLFSSEEIVSMAILLSLMLSGTWGISIFHISIRNVLSLLFVVSVAYINGSATGAAAGVAMGVISGMTTSNIIAHIGVYSLCGLSVGLFRETGKWFSSASYIIAFTILKLYSEIGGEFKLIEALIACSVFLCVPRQIFESLTFEFDRDKKSEQLNSAYTDKVKEIFVGRLDNFAEVLHNMSSIVNNLVNNDRLLMKNKSSALIENLADRVCSTCNMNSMCWKRELHYTYTAFAGLIESYQEGRNEVPQEIERKCVKRTSLLKNTEDIVNNFIISEMWRNRLTEGRQILAGQIQNMAVSIRELVEEFSSEIRFNGDVERSIRMLLNRNKIKYSDVFCFEDKKGRITIKISMEACGGTQHCVKNILPLVNEASGKCMCIGDDGCRITTGSNNCTVTLEETPKYHIASYVGRECKSGEKFSGDSYTFGKLKDGTYMVVISDGMGSGPEAGKESRAAVELIEKFTEAGFSKNTAINTVNSIMTLQFGEDEKFSTLDLASIDLYTGEADFMKVGAVPTYIKRGNKIEVIKSKTLPIGVLDKVDIDQSSKKVKNGDIIIMLSDGVLDSGTDDGVKEQWLTDYLENSCAGTPKEMVEDIMNMVKEMGKGKVKDDITLIVSKVYSLY